MVKLKQNDWKTLFPVETFTIGTTKLEITPLSLENVPAMVRDITVLVNRLSEKNIKLGEFSDNLETVLLLVLEDAPGIISTLSGLDVDDLKKLPINIAILLAIKCLEVNFSDQQDLLKNLMTLVEKVTETLALSQGILES